jgi:hypothetical protein
VPYLEEIPYQIQQVVETTSQKSLPALITASRAATLKAMDKPRTVKVPSVAIPAVLAPMPMPRSARAAHRGRVPPGFGAITMLKTPTGVFPIRTSPTLPASPVQSLLPPRVTVPSPSTNTLTIGLTRNGGGTLLTRPGVANPGASAPAGGGSFYHEPGLTPPPAPAQQASPAPTPDNGSTFLTPGENAYMDNSGGGGGGGGSSGGGDAVTSDDAATQSAPASALQSSKNAGLRQLALGATAMGVAYYFWKTLKKGRRR